ncbi:hypothetical protein [Corynebacterium sp. HS2168-gen11]|uniref:hypothetical protein n=1 Tax=Corynebacterium sp. HS2168-gen11 TaxID=2974027 RepID=UPI00216AC42D|nr:hypothetical protein [Corynebacterium sp. HS2168-gen11]MCS4536233.1 hypothetical protein [Corynebacterium sp. HS2168-gen11]
MNVLSRTTALKKTAVAIVAASALVLAACGSEAETAATSGAPSAALKATTVEKTTAAMTKETTTTEAPSSEVTKSSIPEATPEQPAPAPEPAPETLPPLPEIVVTPQAPVQGGQPASPEDTAAISNLVMGLNNAQTLRAYMRYVPDNACSKALAEVDVSGLDYNQIPDIPLDANPEFAKAKNLIVGVGDVVVDGETASANVTTNVDGKQEVAVQRFARENGRWLFCN